MANLEDFNLEKEYKPDPLVPTGNYRGNVISVVYEPERNCITWKVALEGNEGVLSDGSTPIDGNHVYFRNFLPVPGDENEMSSNGRNTKRQTKINMLTKFAEKMKVKMNTKKELLEALNNGDWIGIPVALSISVGEYLGNARNEVNSMTRSE
jgi:hypothetical protein